MFSLLNTYAPNDKRARDSFLIGIDTILTEQSNGIEILGGDFNEILSNADRISQSQKQKSKSRKCLLELIKSHNLSDVWRDKNPHKSQYTWKRKNHLKKAELIFGW